MSTVRAATLSMDVLEGAACNNHPRLSPDAWCDFKSNRPGAMGMQALLVCRTACPVLRQCRSLFVDQAPGTFKQIIVGGSWYNSSGKLCDADVNLYDTQLTATYMGIDARWVQQRIGAGRGFTPVHREKSRAYFTLANVRYMSRKVGLQCGSDMAEDLHVLKGEWPCQTCLSVRRLNATRAA